MLKLRVDDNQAFALNRRCVTFLNHLVREDSCTIQNVLHLHLAILFAQTCYFFVTLTCISTHLYRLWLLDFITWVNLVECSQQIFEALLRIVLAGKMWSLRFSWHT